jgi:hypothetical protein
MILVFLVDTRLKTVRYKMLFLSEGYFNLEHSSSVLFLLETYCETDYNVCRKNCDYLFEIFIYQIKCGMSI